ncbi:hypothetical protein L1887_41729 [Cichorium endivia]|nr:hypothetical protein L1887_41729 [Cichorium endivia]
MCKCRSHGTFPLFGLQSSHLNICYYHQDPHRRPLRPGSRPRFCSDRRALLLIGAWHLPRRPGVGRALKRHPFSGLVDSADERFARQYRCGPSTRVSSGFAPLRHSSPSFGSRQACSHSNPSQKIKVGRRCTPARGIPPISFLAPCGFTHPLTRTHVRLPWSVFQERAEWGAHRPVPGARRYIAETARAATTIDATASPRAYRQLGLWPPHQSAPVHAPSRSADRLSPFHIRPGRIAGPHSLPSRQFQALFDSLFKGTWARSAAEDASPDYNSDSEAVRFSSWADPVRSPLLRESLRALGRMALGATCVQKLDGFDNDPSAGSPTETLLRLLLPLNDKVQWNSRDVAGGEPPTSPRS